ncbi:MAG: hypothetical protein HYT67_01155 [Candidatus Yanofskybacteria bacterium]|nr:hypothetical protein [Candidatus Yanofskybacteria bacterium]
MADENDVFNELEAQRNIESREPEELSRPEPYKMGVGSYILILFALFVDIIEILTVYTGVGAIIAIPLGLLVDVAILIGVGMSKNARKQWKRFALGFVAENFPILASVLEFIPFRTLALIWMYRGMSIQAKKQPEEENINE